MNLLVVTRLTVELVHADRFRDVAEDQRTQGLHAFDEEQVLLADDLSCNLQDRVGPLVKRLDQPVSGMETLRDVFLFRLAADLATYLCEVALVDQNPRQRLGIQPISQPPSGCIRIRISGVTV